MKVGLRSCYGAMNHNNNCHGMRWFGYQALKYMYMHVGTYLTKVTNQYSKVLTVRSVKFSGGAFFTSILSSNSHDVPRKHFTYLLINRTTKLALHTHACTHTHTHTQLYWIVYYPYSVVYSVPPTVRCMTCNHHFLWHIFTLTNL